MDIPHRLSKEALSLILDDLTLGDIIRVSHVCEHLRAAAHGHHTFWANVAISSTAPIPLDRFISRLSSSKQLGVTVKISLPNVDPKVASVVLRQVAANLHRISHLDILVHRMYEYDLFDALQGPAPRLRSLRLVLRLVKATARPADFPDGIFDGQAPLLMRNSVLLRGIRPPVLKATSHGLLSTFIPDYTARCPPEILKKIFDWLPFNHLLRASHVSRLWRNVGRAHPTLWRSVELCKSSKASLCLFQFLVGLSIDKPIEITVTLRHDKQGITPDVLIIVSKNLCRTTRLVLVTHPKYAIETFSALENAAPVLLSLTLGFYAVPRISSRLDSSIFAEYAPALTDIMLRNTGLPDGQISAFRSVESVSYTCLQFPREGDSEQPLSPLPLLTAFPAAHSLQVRHFRMPLAISEGEEAILAIEMARIRVLDVGDSDLLSVLPVDAVKDLYVRGRLPFTAAHTSLPGPLRCKLHVRADFKTSYMFLSLVSTQTGQGLHFRHLLSEFREQPKYLYDHNHENGGDWGEEVTELQVFQSLWRDAIGYLPRCCNATSIILTLDVDGGSLADLLEGHPISLSHARRLTVETVFEHSFISAEELCAFVTTCILDLPDKFKLELELKGPLIIKDDYSHLSERFSRVIDATHRG